MDEIDDNRKEKLWNKVKEFSGHEMDFKEKEVLRQVLSSEITLKALGALFSAANSLPMYLIGLDLLDNSKLNIAIQTQGRMNGIVESIDFLFELAALPEEKEDE